MKIQQCKFINAMQIPFLSLGSDSMLSSGVGIKCLKKSLQDDLTQTV